MARTLMIFVYISIFGYFVEFVGAAHYIAGMVNNGADGTNANGRTIVLWQQSNGLTDNVTDVVGLDGNSGAENTYLIDCEMLDEPCEVNDILSVMIAGESAGRAKNVTVGGFGFDVVETIWLNSVTNVASVILDDDIYDPAEEVDLISNSTREIACVGIAMDLDGEDEMTNASAKIWNIAESSSDGMDNKNIHYSNLSCAVDLSYGDDNQSLVNCSFHVEYYANAGDWMCNISVEDNFLSAGYGADSTKINTLLALDVADFLDYGLSDGNGLSQEKVLNVTNFGNVRINLSFYGYSEYAGDNMSMNCSTGGGIPVYFEKFNLTSSNSGVTSLHDVEEVYSNLSGEAAAWKFDLLSKQDGGFEGINSTYWRAYIPPSFGGNCSGAIVIGALAGGGL